MNKETLCELADYHIWANNRVWDCVMALAEAQFYEPLSYSVGSIHNQVVHTMSAEWIWLARLKGEMPTAMLRPQDYPTRADVWNYWQAISQELRAHIQQQPEATFYDAFAYRMTNGNTGQHRRGQILLQVFNHGTDHRAQILAMIHTLGGPTIEQDYLFYLRETKG